MSMRIRRFIKVLSLLGVTCFFLPFVCVSCGSENIQLSGVRLMGTYTVQMEGIRSIRLLPNFLVIISAILAMATVISIWAKRKDLLSGGLSAGTVIGLLLFRYSIPVYYSADSSAYLSLITLRFGIGWNGALVCFAILVALLLLFPELQEIVLWMQNTDVIHLEQEQDIFCGNCGEIRHGAGKVCAKCGKKFINIKG